MAAPAFDLQQLAMVAQALARGELLVAAHFRIPALPSLQYPYEVMTLAELQGPERAVDALAHLVVYERERPRGCERLYRICLQDDVILRQLSGSDEGLPALLVYVLTHELVHVVRFQRAEQSFTAPPRRRRREEDEVHRITLKLLDAAGEPRWQRLSQRVGNPVVPARRIRDDASAI